MLSDLMASEARPRTSSFLVDVQPWFGRPPTCSHESFAQNPNHPLSRPSVCPLLRPSSRMRRRVESLSRIQITLRPECIARNFTFRNFLNLRQRRCRDSSIRRIENHHHALRRRICPSSFFECLLEKCERIVQPHGRPGLLRILRRWVVSYRSSRSSLSKEPNSRETCWSLRADYGMPGISHLRP